MVALQREVQRKLGRCLIRLQQYERLAKAILAEQEIAGPLSKLQAIRERRIAEVSTKTLGQLAGALEQGYLSPTLGQPDRVSDDEPQGTSNEIWLRHTHCIELSPEKHAEVVADIKALVALRNELVHHFLEVQDILSIEGCVKADRHLDDCYERIDRSYREMHGWATTGMEAKQRAAAFMQTPEFIDMLLHGILPGGGVHWEASTIVRLLREAETKLANDGWTLLKDAVALIGREHPDHGPRRYGCNGWRHLLHESRQFLLRKERFGNGMPTLVWYRTKA
ncbi:hypothetical protein AZKH_1417 [Azoarcus sp. KH32C]|nr:hypothetical protein AZKH_1417 [Azoarcus sp. KH32C]